MAFDTFLKLEAPAGPAVKATELKGETLDKTYVGAIEIAEFSFGVENPTTIGSASGGAGAGKATFKEFTIKKLVDSVTPSLFTALCTGTHFGEVLLYLRKSGAAAGTIATQTYLTFRFKMVFVTDISFSGASGDDVPSETITFRYGAMQISYKPQDSTGKLGVEKMALWSQVKNAAVLE
jgi:type VI secretion system secreted protein Hcp